MAAIPRTAYAMLRGAPKATHQVMPNPRGIMRLWAVSRFARMPRGLNWLSAVARFREATSGISVAAGTGTRVRLRGGFRTHRTPSVASAGVERTPKTFQREFLGWRGLAAHDSMGGCGRRDFRLLVLRGPATDWHGVFGHRDVPAVEIFQCAAVRFGGPFATQATGCESGESPA